MKLWQELDRLYNTTDNLAAYSSHSTLYKAAKHLKLPVTHRLLNEYLNAQNSYTLHKTTRRRFKRNKFEVFWVDQLHALDLMDIQKLSRWNSGIKFVALLIDCFSRYVWLFEMKDKSGLTMARVLDKFYSDSQRAPVNLVTDFGGEFVNKHCKSVFDKFSINHYYDSGEAYHVPHAERAIQSIYQIMHRYMTATNGKRYLDQLQNFAKIYNARPHRALKGAAPVSVNLFNQKRFLEQQWPLEQLKRSRLVKFQFQIGQIVRVQLERAIFYKGYKQQNSDEKYLIAKRIVRRYPLYKLQDLAGQVISGTYQEKELVLVSSRSEEK